MKVKLWDLNTRACVQTLSDHTDQVGALFDACTPLNSFMMHLLMQVWAVAFSDDGNRVASVSDDKTAITYSFGGTVPQT